MLILLMKVITMSDSSGYVHEPGIRGGTVLVLSMRCDLGIVYSPFLAGRWFHQGTAGMGDEAKERTAR